MDNVKPEIRNKPDSDSRASDRLANLFVDQDELVGKIRRSLSCLGYAELNNVSCVADGGQVTLSGSLNSFYLKQVAQSVAIKVPGVSHVNNQIEVT